MLFEYRACDVDISIRENLDALNVHEHHKDEYMDYVRIAKKYGVVIVYDNSISHHWDYKIYPDIRYGMEQMKMGYCLYSFDTQDEVYGFCYKNELTINEWILK